MRTAPATSGVSIAARTPAARASPNCSTTQSTDERLGLIARDGGDVVDTDHEHVAGDIHAAGDQGRQDRQGEVVAVAAHGVGRRDHSPSNDPPLHRRPRASARPRSIASSMPTLLGGSDSSRSRNSGHSRLVNNEAVRRRRPAEHPARPHGELQPACLEADHMDRSQPFGHLEVGRDPRDPGRHQPNGRQGRRADHRQVDERRRAEPQPGARRGVGALVLGRIGDEREAVPIQRRRAGVDRVCRTRTSGSRRPAETAPRRCGRAASPARRHGARTPDVARPRAPDAVSTRECSARACR